MQTITRSKLKDLLYHRSGASIVTVVSRTEPDMRKRDNPFYGKVCKVAQVNGMVGFRYKNSVNNQRFREGQPVDDGGNVVEFEPLPRKWGNRLYREDVDPNTGATVRRLTPLVLHKGRHYLELKVERLLSMHYQDEDGNPVPAEDLHPWLRQRSGESSRQLVERPVVLRDYALDSIEEIRMDGVIYRVIEDPDPAQN